jgi:hypothetical protein
MLDSVDEEKPSETTTTTMGALLVLRLFSIPHDH